MLEILNVFTSGALPAERTPRALPAGRILNQDDRADIVYDITPWLDTKIAAALCHKTQHAMFLRNSRAPTIADMAWKTETFHIWKGPLPKGLRNRGQS